MGSEVRIVLRLELPDGVSVAGDPPNPPCEGGQYTPKPVVKRPNFVTDEGVDLLGRYLKETRETLGFDKLSQFLDRVQALTGHRLHYKSVQSLELGNCLITAGHPRWNLLAILAATGFYGVHGELYEAQDLFLVACERLDPWTGEMV